MRAVDPEVVVEVMVNTVRLPVAVPVIGIPVVVSLDVLFNEFIEPVGVVVGEKVKELQVEINLLIIVADDVLTLPQHSAHERAFPYSEQIHPKFVQVALAELNPSHARLHSPEVVAVVTLVFDG